MSSAEPIGDLQSANDNKDRDHSESDWEPTPLDASLQESDLDILLGASRNGVPPEQIHDGASEPTAPEAEADPSSQEPPRNEPSAAGVTVEIEVSIKQAAQPAPPTAQSSEESPSRILLPDGGGDEDNGEEEDQHTTASSPDIQPESPPSPLHTPTEGVVQSVPLLEIPVIPQAELEQIQAAAAASTATERETERTVRTRALDLVAEVGAWLEDNPSSLELGQLASTATTVTRTETFGAAEASEAARERQLPAETRATERATVERTLTSAQMQLRQEQSAGSQTLTRTEVKSQSQQVGATAAAGVEREREADRELDVEAIIAKYRALYPGTYAELDRMPAPRAAATSGPSQYSYLSRYTDLGLGLGSGLDTERESGSGSATYRVDTLDTALSGTTSRHRDLSPGRVLASLDAKAKWSLPKDLIDLPPDADLPATRAKSSPPRSPTRSPPLALGSGADSKETDAVLEDYLRSTRRYLSLGSSNLYSASGSTAGVGVGAGSLRAPLLLPPSLPNYPLASEPTAAAVAGMSDTQLLVLCARCGCDEAVGRWLQALQLPNLAKYVEIFGHHEMDMESVRLLTIPQLHAMGIRAIGPLNKLLYAVRRMRPASARHASLKSSAAAATEVDAATTGRTAQVHTSTTEETVSARSLEKRLSAEKTHFELPRGVNPPSFGFESAREMHARRSRSAKSENKLHARSPPRGPAVHPASPPPSLTSGLDRLEVKNAQLRELLNEHITHETYSSKQHSREHVSSAGATPTRPSFRPPRGSNISGSGTAAVGAGAPPLTHPPMVFKSAPQPPLVMHAKPGSKMSARKSLVARSSQTPVSRGSQTPVSRASQTPAKRSAPKSEPPPPPIDTAAEAPPQPPLELPVRAASPPPAEPRRASKMRHTEGAQTEGGYSNRAKQTRSSVSSRNLKSSESTSAACRTRAPLLVGKRVAGRLAADRALLAARSKRSPRVQSSACASSCVCRRCCAGDSLSHLRGAHFPFQDEIQRLECKIQHLLELSSAAYQRNLEKFSTAASSSCVHSSRARSSSSRALLAGDASARRSPRTGSLGTREAARSGENTTSAREACRAHQVDAGLSSSRSLGDMGLAETNYSAPGDLRLKSTQQLMQMIDRLQSRLLNIQARASEQHRLLVKEQQEPPADLPQPLPLAPTMSGRSASEDDLADGAGVLREVKPGALTPSKLELLKELVADDPDSNPSSCALEPRHREQPSPPTQDPGPSQRDPSRPMARPPHSQRSPTKGSPHAQASRRGVETGKTFVLNAPTKIEVPKPSARHAGPLQIPLEMKRTDLIFHQRMSEYVGEGQFTRVYRGALAQPLTDAPDAARLELALKQVKTRLAHKERDYIIGEASALRTLSDGCPQLAKFYGFLLSTISLDVFLIYEYLPFGSLFQYLHSIHATDPLEHVTFYTLAREIALGMNFLHSQPEPVLHLNLKSTNVMLTDQLHVRIADFGFNKLRHACAQANVASAVQSTSTGRPSSSRASLSASSRSVLSAALAPNAGGGLKKSSGYPAVPVYLPPEVLLLSGPSSDLAQAAPAPAGSSGSALPSAPSLPSPTDEPSTATEPSTASTGVERVLMPRSARMRGTQLSPKVDVYSYAIILYELLYRKVPFDGYSLTQLIDGLRKRDRPQFQDDLTSNDLERFITVCWHHVPVNRPSFTEILYRLEQLLLPGKWRQMLQKVPSLSPLAVVSDPEMARALLRHTEKILAELGVVLSKNASKSAGEQTGTQPMPIAPGALELATVTRLYDMLELSDAEIDYIASQIERAAQLGLLIGKDKDADPGDG